MNVSKPTISVLMTVYNREKYIAQTIESVIASTYQNWELIIVDDQSKDRSVEIAESYAAKDTRIKVYINEQNLGDYPNRNKAATYAHGKYLKYVDADDLIYPHGLELLIYYMEQFPEAGYGLCSLDQDKSRIYPYALSPAEAYKKHYFQTPIFNKAPLSSIIRNDAFKAVNGFTGKQHLGDFEMWHVLSKKYNVVLMPKGIVWYREHDEQQMVANRTDPFIPFKYFLNGMEQLLSNSCPLVDNDNQKAIQLQNKIISKAVFSAAKHHSFSKAYQLKKASGKNWYQLVNNLLKK
nr:glycosyltransferase family A protein [uncultured Carboxylicivirga sp.]